MQNTIFSRRRVVTFVCAVSVLAACGTTFAAGTVNLNGSTTVLPVMQQVSEAFMQKNPGVVVTISGTGSGNGIKALRDKMTDVAMSSRDLKDKEKKDFEAHGINPVKIPVALDAIIPVVSPKNAVASLTMEQLRDLFAGKIKNWKELGGADAPVVVVGRDSSSGTFESWQELVMGKTRVSQRALLQSSSGGVVRQSERHWLHRCGLPRQPDQGPRRERRPARCQDRSGRHVADLPRTLPLHLRPAAGRR